MKKTLLSVLISIGFTGSLHAEDLSGIYAQALAKDPVVNRAKALRDTAFTGIKLSRSSLLPKVSGSISYGISESESPTGINSVSSADTDSLGYRIGLSMSLYDHANWVGLDRAEKVAQQSEAAYSATLQNLIVRVTTAYLNILREQDNVEFVQAEKRAIERQLEQTKQRFEVGLTAITDVHEAQANFDTTVAQEIRAQNALELRKEQLREITGKYYNQVNVLNTESFSPTAPAPNSVDEWLKLAEQSNLDLQAARFAVDIAKQDVSGADARHLPTLDLSGSLSGSDLTTNDIDLARTNSSSLGITLNVPIFSGFATTAGSEQARSRFVAESETLEQTYRSTVLQVRNGFNNIKANISTIRAFEQAVVSAESALRATEAGFDVGTRTIVDVLNSTRNLFNARKNLSNARYDFITAVVNLKRAAGTLTVADLNAINQGLIPPAA